VGRHGPHRSFAGKSIKVISISEQIPAHGGRRQSGSVTSDARSRIPLQLTLPADVYPHRQNHLPDAPIRHQTGTIQIVRRVPQSKNLLRRGNMHAFRRPPETSLRRCWCHSGGESAARTYQVTDGRADNRAQLRTVQSDREWARSGDHSGPEAGRTRRGGWRRKQKKANW